MSQSKNGIWGMVFYGAVLLALIGLLCYGLVAPAYAQEDSRTLPILMYHDIVPEGGLLDDYTASVAQLEADLQALAQEGCKPCAFRRSSPMFAWEHRCPRNRCCWCLTTGIGAY